MGRARAEEFALGCLESQHRARCTAQAQRKRAMLQLSRFDSAGACPSIFDELLPKSRLAAHAANAMGANHVDLVVDELHARNPANGLLDELFQVERG